MLKVNEVHAIAVLNARGMSIRRIAKELKCSRNTVRRYLRGAEPEIRAPREYERPVRSAVEEKALELLNTKKTTKKQRWTAPRLTELLRLEGLEASERTVQRILREWRRQRSEVSMPLEYRAGDLAQVDFFEVQVVVRGEQERAFLLVIRLMHSGYDFAKLYRWQDTACFLDGHVQAFAKFGGIPGRLLYDNLRPAVRKVLVGSERELASRYAKFAAYYGLDPRFARPRRGSDKGGVEARGKGIRLQHLTPIPEGDSLDEITDTLQARIDSRMHEARTRGGPARSELWEVERAALQPLPAHPADCSVLLECGADHQAKVRVKSAWYSVPTAWHRLDVQARLYADRVVLSRKGEAVVHTRVGGNCRSIWYPHYMTELCRKPHAIEQIGDQLCKQLGEPFDALWSRLVVTHGRRAASRRLKGILCAIRDGNREEVASRIRAAVRAGEDPVLAAPSPPADARNVVPSRLAKMAVATTGLGRFDDLMRARGGAK
jgi:transposase